MHILFFITLLDAAGFGIVVPLFLYFALELGATPELATMFFSIYPVAMMLAAPLVGKLSDRYGRKPLLLACLFAACIGYLVLGLTSSLLLLAIARFIQGAAAGSLSVVQAYVADITDDESRAKGMGKIGAATGLGFVIGPALGAWLGGGSFENASLEVAAYASAAASFVAFIGVLFFLPESLDDEHKATNRNKPLSFNPFSGVPKAITTPVLREFFICALLFNIAGAFAEVIMPLWLKDYQLINGPRDLMYIFLCAGLVLSLIQAKAIAPVVRRYGENLMFRVGAAGYGIALVLVAFSGQIGSYMAVIASWCLAGASMAFFFTGLQSLVSKCAADHERGAVMGAFSAFGTLGRVIGPSVTGILYAGIHPNAPFYLGACLLLLTLLLGLKVSGMTFKHN